MRRECPCAGSSECLLNRDVRTKLLDRTVQPGPRRTNRLAGDSGHFVHRHVKVEIEDDREPIVVFEARDRAPKVCSVYGPFLFERTEISSETPRSTRALLRLRLVLRHLFATTPRNHGRSRFLSRSRPSFFQAVQDASWTAA